ncbi:hypothetical protein RV14_GL001639 [Enterococcus ratti]|uniref:Uncharacterized protein n=1 Tax=Enterococcus ratti TaxID=150033 RepID=A0A1L8WQK5_9ENTE|nr:hypothetical protein RV14_GL001639 [Enterococcus ratti]
MKKMGMEKKVFYKKTAFLIIKNRQKLFLLYLLDLSFWHDS